MVWYQCFVVLGFNCVFSGGLWILYGSFPNVFFGYFYKNLSFVVDIAFDFGYTTEFFYSLANKEIHIWTENGIFCIIFPILLINRKLFDLTALASLNEENHFIFLTACYSMALMATKIWSVLKSFDINHIKNVGEIPKKIQTIIIQNLFDHKTLNKTIKIEKEKN